MNLKQLLVKPPLAIKTHFHLLIAICGILLVTSSNATARPLTIGYSDWPGWIAWEIGLQKGWFRDKDVDVDFQWMDYVESLDAFAAGKLDAVTATNGDALTLTATGAENVMILVNDFSNGNDIVVGNSSIRDISDLRNKKVGVEVGFVGHLLLLNALFNNGMSMDSVELVDVPTDRAPELLGSGQVSAIVAWQPHSGRALRSTPGATAVYSSRDEPGIIYDVLTVTPRSLKTRKREWQKVVEVWYDIVDYINDPETADEAIRIMAKRANLDRSRFKQVLAGTKLLSRTEVSSHIQSVNGYKTIYGSSKIVDSFNIANDIYGDIQNVDDIFDFSLTASVVTQ